VSAPESPAPCRHCGAAPSVDTSERDAKNSPFLDHPLNGCYYGGWHLSPRIYQDACASLPEGPDPEGKGLNGSLTVAEPSAQEDIKKAFCAGFVAGYSNADDSYPGPDEDIALANYLAGRRSAAKPAEASDAEQDGPGIHWPGAPAPREAEQSLPVLEIMYRDNGDSAWWSPIQVPKVGEFKDGQVFRFRREADQSPSSVAPGEAMRAAKAFVDSLVDTAIEHERAKIASEEESELLAKYLPIRDRAIALVAAALADASREGV